MFLSAGADLSAAFSIQASAKPAARERNLDATGLSNCPKLREVKRQTGKSFDVNKITRI